jgi:hypothetical protein
VGQLRNKLQGPAISPPDGLDRNHSAFDLDTRKRVAPTDGKMGKYTK